MMNRSALDTNVLIYLHDISNPHKSAIAENLLLDEPKISAQVVSEYLNAAKRILNLSKEDLLLQTANLLQDCTIIPVRPQTLSFAASLIVRYNFQLFDAVIVASAIEGQCDILYSEDMHDGLVVDKRLTIKNPFI